ncbi:succinate dehydrogenase / fumarate reductase cytochrome b subunit [Ereboglobus sp. PH5-5]|uniref:succinate dehydrogenase cytochrome b subunit n=1 Tax=Ereboglobus sp. PH5-5 TaxID=2940529 RepID=UPI002404E253|nr:succinate dehydrogenase cytochrome b subunit [Ereboglobus sp. PH5-5]MDF9831972.1 succinate dehydrogenase / fumarate reductase cytochrome b subunit [Ereboglobus sp. PH5-5]
MTPIANLVTSSIGRKFLMALTGLVLTGFVTGHMVGNLQIFLHPDHINGYAHFLQGLGLALWAVRGFLLLCVVIHVWAAVTLWVESKKARGPEKYDRNKWLAATTASRYMRLTGLVVLAFIIYHILHFTVGVQGTGGVFKDALPHWEMTDNVKEFGIPLANKGESVHDVYSMVFLGFMNPVVAGFYMLAVALLAMHLWHGVESLFQTLGWRNHKWSCLLRGIVGLFAFVYLLGNLAMPGLIVSGVAKPAEGTTAAKAAAIQCSAGATQTPAQK